MARGRLLLIMALVVLFVGACSSPSADGNKEKEQQSKEPVKEQPEASVAGKPIHVDEAAFQEKIYDYKKDPKLAFKGDLPCIVDFYADWCGPCKIIAPYMEELAAKYQGKIYIYKVNTDNNRELSQFFNIQSIPSVMFCPMSGQPTMTIGANPKEEYEKLINKLLLK